MVDGELNKVKVEELALEMDSGLLKLLLSEPALKKHFFTQVDDIQVFDKIKFQRFINNKSFLPDSYTVFKNKIGLTDESGNFISESREVVLSWPHKDCILEGGQDKEDAKRDEIFFNEILAPDQIDHLLEPKVLKNFKKYDASGEHDVTGITYDDNLLIEGNNLLSIWSLLKNYTAKVDLIYIDPPYNTRGNADTFCYNNTFKRSTWLTFMKNRLEVSKKLLKKDGVLIVAIDENEQVHLGVLLKDMFPDHDVHCITIVHNPRGIQGTNFSYTNEFAFFVLPKGIKSIGDRKIEEKDIQWRNLRDNGGESLREDARNCFYGMKVKDSEIIGFTDVADDTYHPESNNVYDGDILIIYPVDPQGIERKWRYARQSVEKVQHLLRVKKGKGTQYEIEIGKDFGSYRTVWQDPRYDSNEYGTKLIKSLVPDCKFDFPKSLWNVYDCLHTVVSNNKDALVLDFFGGSGTTAHAVMELNKTDNGNRKFILCEQMHYVKSVTRERIKAVIQENGQNSFIYCELAKCNQSYVDMLMDAKNDKALISLLDTIKDKGFISYKVDKDKFDGFEGLSFDEKKKFLIEVLDKNMLYVNLSEIEDKDHDISKDDIKLNRLFYSLEKQQQAFAE